VNLRRVIDVVNDGSFARDSEPTYARDILDEAAFRKMISLERRRTERSRRPFLLMLVDFGDHVPSETVGRNLRKLLGVLLASTRATDAAGWYKDKWIVGVMFTEIALDDRGTIVNTMMARLSDILQNHLSLEQFNQVSVSFHVFPDDWDQGCPKRPSNPVLYPDLSNTDSGKPVSGGLKRAMDIVGSIGAMILFAPVFVLVAVAVKVTSKGPVIFRQERIGQQGQPFVFFKFRSMTVNNDAAIHKEYVKQLIAGKAERNPSNGNGHGVFKLTQDPRITPVGSFLRKTSLDELPQFINVLRGEMSLVGPRPALPYEVEAYDLWHRRRILEAKPGITGLWQIAGRNRLSFDEMVRLDLKYARSWSLWLDLKVLLCTPKAVIEGAH
jgi:lipopolysaccharide/colanic/teichoic acid biosynthesis glycosyltransferase